jgi:ferredoxin
VPFRVRVDPDMCEGHAICQLDSPAVFTPDAEGYAQVALPLVPDELRAEIEGCVRGCPAGAIHIED